jgi:hypothetical protein
MKKEKSYRHFMQDDAMAHVANNSTDASMQMNHKSRTVASTTT